MILYAEDIHGELHQDMIVFTACMLYDGRYTITVYRSLLLYCIGIAPKLLHVCANANDSWGSGAGW